MAPKTIARVAALALLALALLAGGCKEYRLNVALDADGGGTRRLELVWDTDLGPETDPSLETIRALFALDEADGWQVTTGDQAAVDQATGAKGKVTHFTRERRLRRPSDWSGASGDVVIRGTLDPESPYAEVGLVNRVSVEVEAAEGGRYLTYTESFAWTGFQEAVVDHFTDRIGHALTSAYTDMDKWDRVRLWGLIEGHLALWLHLQMRDDDLDDDVIAVPLASHALGIVRGSHPEADAETLRAAIEGVMDQSGEEFEAWLAENVPGAFHAGMMGILLQVTLPGRIVDSNAETVEDGTATWKAGFWDATTEPVVFTARAMVLD